MTNQFKSIINAAFTSQETTKKVTIKGIEFVMAATTTKDEAMLAEYAVSSEQDHSKSLEALTNIRARSIASVLRKIGGADVPDVVETDKGPVERVLFLVEEISNWPSPLVAALFYVVTDFKQELREKVRSSVKYEWHGEDLLLQIQKEEEEEEKLRIKQREIEAKKLEKLAADLDKEIAESSSNPTPTVQPTEEVPAPEGDTPAT